MIICPNCGAEIDCDVEKCPYCGFINLEGAEKKFNADITEIKSQIKKTKKEPIKALKTGFSGGIKAILITITVLIVLVGVIGIWLAIELKDHPKEFLSAEEKAYASAYKVMAGEQLAEAYDNNDIDRLALIFDKAYSKDRVSLWGDPHYETGYTASCYVKLQQCIPNLDKKKMTKKEAEAITYYCFYFYYKSYGEDGAKLFDSIRENEILPLLENRLGFTVEDMEGFRTEVTDSSNLVNRTAVYRVTKKFFKNYQ